MKACCDNFQRAQKYKGGNLCPPELSSPAKANRPHLQFLFNQSSLQRVTDGWSPVPSSGSGRLFTGESFNSTIFPAHYFCRKLQLYLFLCWRLFNYSG